MTYNKPMDVISALGCDDPGEKVRIRAEEIGIESRWIKSDPDHPADIVSVKLID